MKAAAKLVRVVVASVMAVGLGGFGVGQAAAQSAWHAPGGALHVLPLPNGYSVEGIAINQDMATFYADSHANGDIYAGNMFTGRGKLLVKDTTPGEQAYGVSLDSRGRLWVAYGSSGQVRAFDPVTGKRLATYQLGATDGSSLINDLIVTRHAVYATDSIAQLLYAIPLPRNGAMPIATAGQTIPITGDMVYSPTGTYNLPFNGNGIETTPDGTALLIDQTNQGKLFRLNPETGVTKEVKLTGGNLAYADGLRRLGNVLYVAQNDSSKVAKVILNNAGTAGAIVAHPTGTRPYARPATLAVFCGRMYVSQMVALAPYATPDWIDSFSL